jgi:hypothetical protein
MKLLLIVFLVFIAIPSVSIGGENCGMMGGQCRDTCNQDEEAIDGAFIDCTDKQECCVPKPPKKDQSKDTESQEKWKKQAK